MIASIIKDYNPSAAKPPEFLPHQHMTRFSTKNSLIGYFLKMLDQQAEQDATNLATETLMDFLAAREMEQQELATDVAGRSQFKVDLTQPINS